MVEAPLADAAIRRLHAAGLLDPTRRVRKRPGEVLVPVRAEAAEEAWARALGARVEEDEAPLAREDRATPRARALEALAARLPPGLLDAVPEGWELLGDVLVLRLPDALLPHARDVAGAFADALGARCVVLDRGGVSGELREMRGEVVLGDDPRATHVENGVRYRLDASRVMFSSGNVAERTRMARAPARGETVVDMFAGVGYFTLPLAVHAGPARVVALEKNPVSFGHLVEGIALNGVEGVVEPWLGDNRDYPGEGVADRVVMGYFPGTERFLPKALRLLKPGGGVVHYHNTAHAARWREELEGQVAAAAAERGVEARVEEARVVKSHSPGVVHAALDVRIRGPRSPTRT